MSKECVNVYIKITNIFITPVKITPEQSSLCLVLFTLTNVKELKHFVSETGL